jgi:hypothetical protein
MAPSVHTTRIKPMSGTAQESPGQIFTQGLFEESAVAKHKLGTLRVLDDGRVFRYSSITAAAITAGALVSKAFAPVDATIAAADAAINLVGAKKITLTVAGATADLYKDGWLIIKAGTGIGEMYKIRGNTATDDPAAGRAYFELYDALRSTHVAANTTVAVHQSPYSNLLLNPAVANATATTQETAMGMTTMACGNGSAASYLWLQTKGIASLVLDIDAAAGAEANEMRIVPGTTAGRGAVTPDTAISGIQIIGYTLESEDLTDAEANLVVLALE